MLHWYRPLPIGHGDAAFRLRLTGDPDQIVVTMSFDFPTAPTLTDANALQVAFASNLLTRLPSVMTFEGVHVLYQSDAVDQIVVDSSNAAAVGTMTGSTVLAPVQVALLVRKRTGLAGRRNRGRWYWPGVKEADVDNVGAVDPAALTAYGTAFNNFYGAINPYGPVIVHSCECVNGDASHEGAHSCVPRLPTPITALEVDDRVATQRRRLSR